MAKFYGTIGYSVTTETSPGVWSEVTDEKTYCGDIIKNNRRWQVSDQVNDNLSLNNVISIVADPFAFENFHAMRYIKLMGASWKILSVDIQRPRILLTVGGVYNG